MEQHYPRIRQVTFEPKVKRVPTEVPEEQLRFWLIYGYIPDVQKAYQLANIIEGKLTFEVVARYYTLLFGGC